MEFLEKILKFFSTENKDPASAEKSQKMNIIVIGVGLFAILMFLMLLLGDDNQKKKNQIGQFKIVNENEAVKTKWIGEVAPEIQISSQKVREVLEDNKKLQKELYEMKKMILELKKNQNKPTENTNNIIPKKEEKPQSNLYKNYPLPPNIKPKEVGLVEFGKVPVLKKKIIVKEEPITNALVYTKVSEPQKEKPKPKEIKPVNILPSGSISRVILLGGMDAPTMARAKNNPLPVLMKVTDLAFLPNDWREDVRGCFFLGEGYGDLSSERAYIRVTTLSCITKDGYHIDTPFKGAVYGEDGKVGLRGRVVTKQGALLARTLLAGYLQGIAEAFKQNNTVVSVSPTGTTQTIDPKKAFQAGIYSGASKAAEKLADFYLKMADQVAPVIEISAGRRVDVITLEPVELKPIEFLKKGKK